MAEILGNYYLRGGIAGRVRNLSASLEHVWLGGVFSVCISLFISLLFTSGR